MFKIGELAEICNISADTLRFYEKNGLFQASQRSGAGYRLYTDSDKSRLEFILASKSVGFSLKEISDLLSINLDKSNRTCADAKQLVDDKLIQVREKLAELQKLEHSLQSLSDACCGGPESALHCTILEALANKNTSKPKH
jgi:MerR family Zn(II)-responsive transcriptional regulator of zntA